MRARHIGGGAALREEGRGVNNASRLLGDCTVSGANYRALDTPYNPVSRQINRPDHASSGGGDRGGRRS
jgi:hypothetical protein